MAEDGALEVRIIDRAVDVRGRRRRRPLEARDIDGPDPLTGRFQRGRSNDRFEFAHVARPGMGGEPFQGSWSETAEGFAVTRTPLAEKKSREHRNVVPALAQRREGEANRGEVTGQVGAKGPGSRQPPQRLGGTSD